jgi:glycosyl transferase, family 25
MSMWYDIFNDYFDHVYVITLKRAVERQQQVAQDLAGLRYELFWGSDKQELDIAAMEADRAYSEVLARQYHRYGKGMGPGQIGCSLSHKRIYQDILQKGYQRVLILEDDVYPTNMEQAAAVLAAFPADWQLVMLDYHKNEKRNWFKQQWYHVQHFLGRLKWNHTMIRNLYPRPVNAHIGTMGYHEFTDAYCLTPAAAAVLLELQTPLHFIADTLLPYAATNQLIKGYICRPKLFAQTSTGDGKSVVSFVEG